VDWICVGEDGSGASDSSVQIGKENGARERGTSFVAGFIESGDVFGRVDGGGEDRKLCFRD